MGRSSGATVGSRCNSVDDPAAIIIREDSEWIGPGGVRLGSALAEVEVIARATGEPQAGHFADLSTLRPIAGRSRCTRPSGWVTVPSFSG